MKINQYLVFGLTIAILVIAGCVSTTTGIDANQSDPQAAARYRTALAAEYIQSNQLDAAKRSLAQALKTDPNSAEAHLMMAVLFQQEGSERNKALAEDYYRKAIKLNPEFAAAYNNYGVFLRENKRLPEALIAFEKAANSLGYGARAQTLENLGRTALLAGDKVRAKNAFLRAVQVDPNLPVSYLELSEIAFSEKNISEANAYFKNYLVSLGNKPLGPRSLWLGIRLADSVGDDVTLQKYAVELNKLYPNSPENKELSLFLRGLANTWNQQK